MMGDDFEKKLESEIKYSFKIAYNGTDDNKETHKRFTEYAKEETDNSYILALKRLLESSEADWKFQAICEKVDALEMEIAELKMQEEEKGPRKIKTLGGEV